MPENPETEAARDRRRHPRVPVRLEVAFRSGEELLSCYMFNVGQGGLFIHSQAPLAMGEDVLVSLHLPGVDRIFEARGRVVWSVPSGAGSVAGMGIAFTRIAPEDQGAIEAFIGEELSR